MRKLLIASFSLSALLTAACQNQSAENASANLEAIDIPHYLVTAGPVTGDRTSGINGTFTLTKATAATAGPEGGIPSDRLGGACIIFRAQDLGYTAMAQKVCNADGDCDTGEGAGYCSSEHKCWGRPAIPPPAHDPLCNRSIDYSPQQPWDVGTPVQISQGPIPLAGYNLQPNAQAVVVALTKGKPPKGQRAVLKWGAPTTIP